MIKVKHRNISNSISGVVLLGADTKKTYVRTIQSLLISNTYNAGSTVSVYIQSVNKAISDKQECLECLKEKVFRDIIMLFI
jgi:peptidoglycan hydrolase-like protein with peptidoglycan-binding domain